MQSNAKKTGAVIGFAAIVAASALLILLAKPSGITCDGNTDTTNAIQAAVNVGGTVHLPAGTCKLTGHIVVNKSETITGAGQSATILIQFARVNIFQITAPGVTIENLTGDTGTHNPGVPPVRKDPVPAVLFSAQSNTTLLNVKAIAGTGFGLRLTGPNPCQNDLVTGDKVTNLVVVNAGTGGFSGLDMDCMASFTINGLDSTGGSLTPYQDRNGTITNMIYHRSKFGGKCQPSIQVTGPSQTITISNVTSYAGKITSHGTRFGNVLNLIITGQTIIGGC